MDIIVVINRNVRIQGQWEGLTILKKKALIGSSNSMWCRSWGEILDNFLKFTKHTIRQAHPLYATGWFLSQALFSFSTQHHECLGGETVGEWAPLRSVSYDQSHRDNKDIQKIFFSRAKRGGVMKPRGSSDRKSINTFKAFRVVEQHIIHLKYTELLRVYGLAEYTQTSSTFWSPNLLTDDAEILSKWAHVTTNLTNVWQWYMKTKYKSH